MRRNRKNLLRIFSGVLLFVSRNFVYPADACRSGAIFCRRFTRKSFEDAIELRERLKARGERDFTDAQFWVAQKITRTCEPGARDILDEIYAGYLLEIFAQVIGVHFDDVCDFGQRKLFACMFFDVLARFPNRDWLGSTPTSRIFNLSNEQHLCHRLMVNGR
jgi:hypothetical protein